ncbi:LAQU0S05e06854g1_1 [Lachancea quebecensis]|uniref:LAQU0S05e06854g1_1 n=1 Tax=Lachancea quebecensis TaxID=1654605 RepID=A0A0N7MLK0_9SACH|nr:LAQU0S05e06854g1_1 [Lachancea quebecensis]
MVTNLWNSLLETNGDLSGGSKTETTVVISGESQAVLQDFLVRVLEVPDANASLSSIGYYCKDYGLDNSSTNDTVLHIYTLEWPVTPMSLDLLSIFAKPGARSIKWVFLLDWLDGNKKLWLRNLNESFELVRQKLQRDPCDIDDSSILCMQSQCCKNLEVASATWNSLKMEFINQALRTVAFLKHASLLALETYTSKEDIIEIRKVVAGQKPSRAPEYIKLNQLFIPKDSDSEGKIKTMGEKFPVHMVLEESFISGQFERLIPGELKSEPITDPGTPNKVVQLEGVDIQKELTEAYNLQKASLMEDSTTPSSLSMEPLDRGGLAGP